MGTTAAYMRDWRSRSKVARIASVQDHLATTAAAKWVRANHPDVWKQLRAEAREEATRRERANRDRPVAG